MTHRSSSALPGLLALSVFSVLAAHGAAPTFPAHPDNTDVPPNLPVGKTLIIPLAADDADGDPLSYTVKSSNPKIHARVRTGNFHHKMRVITTDDGTTPGTPKPFLGDMEFELYRAAAPETAAFIAGYAQAGYYDNVKFHRVIPDFVIQGGDPLGTGEGDSPYTIPNEFVPELIYSGRGQLAMANKPGHYTTSFPSGSFLYKTGKFLPTNGSQFFVTLGQPRHLDFKHTLFGQLVRGFDMLDKIAGVATDPDGLPDTGDEDMPKTAVTMSSHTVTASQTDGVLLLSASDSGSAVITITVKDPSGASATKMISVNAVVDTTNDPPILQPFSPVVMPVGGVPSFSIRSLDLEHDAISTRMPLQDLLQGRIIYAGVSGQNLQIVAPTDAGAWDVSVGVAGLNDPLLDADPLNASDFKLLEVGIGDTAIVAEAQHVEGTANVALPSTVLATFRHGAAGASPDDFVATVNWGDGTELRSSSVSGSPITIVRSATLAATFEVRGGHNFARAGFFPLHVTIDNVNGATATAKGTSTVYPPGTTLRATGEDLVFQGANFSGRPIAYFTDSAAGASSGVYSVTVDWGDGQRTPGEVKQVAANRFAVFGTHRYVDSETFSLAVRIKRTASTAEAVAWGSITLTGFEGTQYLPPFANANLTTIWSQDPSKIYRTVNATDLTATLFLINGGNKPTGKWKLRFWLSSDANLDGGADTPLKFGPLNHQLKELSLNSLPPGGGGNLTLSKFQGGDFTIRLPARETAAGKYLLAEVDYNDPLTNKLPVRKVLPFGPISGILLSKTGLTIREGVDPALGKDTFKIRLDTPATSTVEIPLEITTSSSSTVDATRAIVSPAKVVITPADGTSEKTVEITVIDDLIKNSSENYAVRLKPAISTDPRFNGMDGPDISLRIIDFPRNIVVSRTTATIRESVLGSVTTTATFNVNLQALPAQNVTVPFQIENSAGAVDNSRATLSVSQLVFTPTNGTTAQTVTISVVNDTDVNGTGTYSIRFLPSVSTDPNYTGRTTPKITLTVQDDDTAANPPAGP